MNDYEATKSRVEGRKHAECVIQLASEELNGVADSFRVAYWQTIKAEANNQIALLGIAEKPLPRLLQPMPDAEAQVFAETPVPFGKPFGTAIWAALRDDPGYLDWLVRATEEDDFKQKLRRFLARNDVQEELPD